MDNPGLDSTYVILNIWFKKIHVYVCTDSYEDALEHSNTIFHNYTTYILSMCSINYN